MWTSSSLSSRSRFRTSRKKVSGFVYKGNPLIHAVDNSAAFRETREEFLAKTGLPDRPMIALLAGSRNGEISSMMPTFN